MTAHLTRADQLTDEHIRELAAAITRYVLEQLADHDYVGDALHGISDRNGVVHLNTVCLDLDDASEFEAVSRAMDLLRQNIHAAEIPNVLKPAGRRP